jgi:GT2 family glycosyltransferase
MFEQKKPLVSIIIPSWFIPNSHGRYGKNEVYYVASKCLERLLDVTPRELYELIIIDNGSTLQTKDISTELKPLEWYWSQADILIKNDSNLGFGKAVENGIEKATGEIICQMNNDILVFDKWLENILEAFKKEMDPPIGMIMPNLIKKEFQKDCVGENGKLYFEKVLKLKSEDVVLRNIDVLEPHAQFGSLWCIKKELVDRLIETDGFFFDPQFEFLFKEDRDVYQRIYSLGAETYRINTSRVFHAGNLTVNKVEGHKEISKKNRELYEKKWGGKEK